MRQGKVLDLSFSRIPDTGWVERRVADGVEMIIQDVWTGGYANNDRLREVAEPNLRMIRQGGATPAIYTNAAPWRTPETWFWESVRNAGAELEHAQHVMVDLEIANGYEVIDPDDVWRFLRMWEDTGRKILTYSGDWYVRLWKAILGLNSLDFGKPYVHARYDGIPELLVNQPRHPLGPLAGKQYGWTDIEGVTVDLNVFDMDIFKKEEADDMPRLVRKEGTSHVYVVTGAHLESVVSQEVAGTLGYDLTKVENLPPGHPIWKLPALFGGGPASDD